jgi:hypothetical protein
LIINSSLPGLFNVKWQKIGESSRYQAIPSHYIIITSLENANLTGLYFGDTWLIAVNMRKANLTNAFLRRTNNKYLARYDIDLRGANLYRTNVSNLDWYNYKTQGIQNLFSRLHLDSTENIDALLKNMIQDMSHKTFISFENEFGLSRYKKMVGAMKKSETIFNGKESSQVWGHYTGSPIEQASKLCYSCRQIRLALDLNKRKNKVNSAISTKTNNNSDEEQQKIKDFLELRSGRIYEIKIAAKIHRAIGDKIKPENSNRPKLKFPADSFDDGYVYQFFAFLPMSMLTVIFTQFISIIGNYTKDKGKDRSKDKLSAWETIRISDDCRKKIMPKLKEIRARYAVLRNNFVCHINANFDPNNPVDNGSILTKQILEDAETLRSVFNGVYVDAGLPSVHSLSDAPDYPVSGLNKLFEIIYDTKK